MSKQLSKEKLQEYWLNPNDNRNKAEDYLSGHERTDAIFNLIKPYLDDNVFKEASIMEIGCNVGRNLKKFYDEGYTHLLGIEPNKKAVELMQQNNKEVYSAFINNMFVEDYFKNKKLSRINWNVLFTMACLEHIPYESDYVFEKIVKNTKNLIITVEDEKTVSIRHFPRNYKQIFEKFNFKQVFEHNCKDIKGLGESFVLRVFEKC